MSNFKKVLIIKIISSIILIPFIATSSLYAYPVSKDHNDSLRIPIGQRAVYERITRVMQPRNPSGLERRGLLAGAFALLGIKASNAAIPFISHSFASPHSLYITALKYSLYSLGFRESDVASLVDEFETSKIPSKLNLDNPRENLVSCLTIIPQDSIRKGILKIPPTSNQQSFKPDRFIQELMQRAAFERGRRALDKIKELIKEGRLPKEQRDSFYIAISYCLPGSALFHLIAGIYTYPGDYQQSSSPVRFGMAPGHAFAVVYLDKENILLLDPLGKARRLNLLKYYEKQGESWVLRPEWRIDPFDDAKPYDKTLAPIMVYVRQKLETSLRIDFDEIAQRYKLNPDTMVRIILNAIYPCMQLDAGDIFRPAVSANIGQVAWRLAESGISELYDRDNGNAIFSEGITKDHPLYRLLKSYDEVAAIYSEGGKSLYTLPNNQGTLYKSGAGVASQLSDDKRLKLLEIAESFFKQSLEINPGFAYPYLNLGILYCMKKEYAKAKDAFEKAKQLLPWFPLTYYYLGHTYYKLGMTEEAKTAWARAGFLDKSLLNDEDIPLDMRSQSTAINFIRTGLLEGRKIREEKIPNELKPGIHEVLAHLNGPIVAATLSLSVNRTSRNSL